ncbi:2Fe-2S iron-sulfur cluster-binding protein [Streptomyces broussonetiae]|uniref:2Fe-2S iron-sulfur cluster-binding protein n=1 Tax=Streptomyces broussonetiae TaxID=2686304 RepID=UPI001E5F1F0C|nr:2Fe-2S iron-sulfur cluster-binding protein [Streptomyces broussonetiae]
MIAFHPLPHGWRAYAAPLGACGRHDGRGRRGARCGACTVDLDGGSVKSCCPVLATQADRCGATTREGLARGGARTALQRASHGRHALRCGCRTPGPIMAAHDPLRGDPRPAADRIRQALQGSLCLGVHHRHPTAPGSARTRPAGSRLGDGGRRAARAADASAARPRAPGCPGESP